MECKITTQLPSFMDRLLPPPSYINSFNAVRFIAAIHIVSGHFFERTLVIHRLPADLVVLLSSSASYSTSLFFVLSGFVLAYTRQRRIDQGRSNQKPFQLLVRHLMRGTPYMIIGATLACAIEVKRHGISVRLLLDYLYSLSFIPPFLLRGPPLNAPAWAMSVFVLGYIIDAYFGQRLSAKSSGQSVVGILIAICLLYSLTFFYSVLIPSTPSYPPKAYDFRSLAIHVFPLTRIFEIILGMFLGALTYSRYFQIKAMIGITFFPHRLVTFSTVVLNAVCLALIARMSGDSAFLATHGLLLAPMCIMLVTLAASDDWISSPKLAKLFSFMGRFSLPIYLLHYPSMHLYKISLNLAKVSLESGSWLFILGYLGVLSVLSILAMFIVFAISSMALRIRGYRFD